MTSSQNSNENKIVLDIDIAFRLNRRLAREQYNKKFGRRIDDPAIDDEFERAYIDAITDGNDTVAVPARLALAFVMRPRGRGRGRKHPPKEIAAVRIEQSAISFANRRWAELTDDLPTKVARLKAAEEAHAKFGQTARVGVETIKSKMNLTKGRAALERR
jgi:hypothetical protein